MWDMLIRDIRCREYTQGPSIKRISLSKKHFRSPWYAYWNDAAKAPESKSQIVFTKKSTRNEKSITQLTWLITRIFDTSSLVPRKKY